MTYSEQAKKICNSLSLPEKIGQITYLADGFRSYIKDGNKIFFTNELKAVAEKYSVGASSALLRGDPWTKKGYGTGIEIQERTQAVWDFQNFVLVHSAHKIPALIDIEASHGMQSLGSVMYPVGLCSAAAWNPQLYEKIMQRIAEEIKASGNHIAFVTMIDLARDPRWGRCEECLGEDPYLASRYISRGIAGIRRAGVLACAKHFFGSGSAEGGGNAAAITVSDREIREILLPTAKAAVDAGCDLIMVAYNALNGTPMHFSYHYLTEVLRGELSFDGIILSDGCGVSSAAYQVRTSPEQSAILALKAGINMSLCDQECFITLAETAKDNSELLELIDYSCQKVLEKKLFLGLLDNPFPPTDALAEFMPNAEGIQLAYEMAAESITLVKNEKNILPFKADTKICVIGENAANIYFLLGDYTSDRAPGEGVTIKDGIHAVFPNAVYEQGWSFDSPDFDEHCLTVAKDCDAVVLCLGGSSVRHANVTFLPNGAMAESTTYIDCGEGGDLSGLKLPQVQEKLLDALRKLGKPIVSLFVVGRAYAITNIIEKSHAALICWYPGQEGGRAIADILSGKVNPSGKLPVSLPEDAGCLPVCYNSYTPERKYCDNNQNTHPFTFGYGLSYTQFTYSHITVRQDSGRIYISGSVTNTGDFDGKETVQLYIHKMGGTVIHRAWELMDFCKRDIKRGESFYYSFEISYAQLRDVMNQELPEQLKLKVGNHVVQLKLTGGADCV